MPRSWLLVLVAVLGSCAPSAAPSSSAVEALTAVEEAFLTAGAMARADSDLGHAVAISADGQRVIVGAPDDPVRSTTRAGGFMIFARAGATWVQEAWFAGTDPQAFLGNSVAIDATGARVVVGAYRAPASGVPVAGAAFVYTRSGSSWTREVVLVDSSPASDDFFGISVAITEDGSRALVAARQDDTARGDDSGSVRVFARSGSSWMEEAVLLCPGGSSGDNFGSEVAVSADGTRALVGAFLDDVDGLVNAGSAHTFVRVGASWTYEAELRNDAPAAGDFFGGAVALTADGSRALVGAELDDSSASDAGSATVFTHTGGSWTREARLTAVGAEATDAFGHAVSLSSDGARAVVGARGDTTAAGTDAGSARVFVRSGTTWTEERTLLAADGAPSDELGHAVSISADGSRCVVGAPGDDTVAGNDAGSARVFSLATSPLGATCRGDAACASGFCVDGVCCGTRCAGGSPCQGCSAARTGVANGTCAPLTGAAAAATVCRAATDLCDAPEVCTAGSLACPSDSLRAAGTQCRTAPGACDVAETCTGASAACPSDRLAPAGTTCRTAAGACDVADVCTGTGASCPADLVAPSGSVCRASRGVCDVAEACDGSGPLCPPDGVLPSGRPCRSPAGACDAEESCNGLAPTCPSDVFLAPSVTCRAASGLCDAAELCTGASAACPPDLFALPSVVCRPPSGEACDAPDHCSGTSADCVDAFLSGVPCREAIGACDLTEVCTGASPACPPDGRRPAGLTCRESEDLSCDPAESCDGVGASCPGDVSSCAGRPDAWAGLSDAGGERDASGGDSSAAPDAGSLPPAAAGCVCRVGARPERGAAMWMVVLALAVTARATRRARGARPISRG